MVPTGWSGGSPATSSGIPDTYSCDYAIAEPDSIPNTNCYADTFPDTYSDDGYRTGRRSYGSSSASCDRQEQIGIMAEKFTGQQ